MFDNLVAIFDNFACINDDTDFGGASRYGHKHLWAR
jgi:hypothetical protein